MICDCQVTVLMSPLLCASCISGLLSAAVPGDPPSMALLILYLPLLSVLAGVIFPRTVVSLCPPHVPHYCVVCLLLSVSQTALLSFIRCFLCLASVTW